MKNKEQTLKSELTSIANEVVMEVVSLGHFSLPEEQSDFFMEAAWERFGIEVEPAIDEAVSKIEKGQGPAVFNIVTALDCAISSLAQLVFPVTKGDAIQHEINRAVFGWGHEAMKSVEAEYRKPGELPAKDFN